MLLSKYKVMFSINTDSHSISHMDFMRYGVGTARRGWLKKDKVLNALNLISLQKILAK
jgi:Histidinol phosphatase and related hydrolases of the PHP family